jgi:hypothetical protein
MKREGGSGTEEIVTTQRKRDKKSPDTAYSSGSSTGAAVVFLAISSMRSSFQARRFVCQTPRQNVVAGKICRGKTLTKGEGSVKLISLYQLV